MNKNVSILYSNNFNKKMRHPELCCRIKISAQKARWPSISMSLCNLLTLYESGDFNTALETEYLYDFFNDESHGNIKYNQSIATWSANDFVFTFSSKNLESFIYYLELLDDITTVIQIADFDDIEFFE